MKKLKWWQWAMGGVVGLTIIGSMAEDPNEGSQATTDSSFEKADAKFRKLTGDNVFAMTFNKNSDPVELPKLIRDHCGARDFCKVLGWTDAEYAPRGFPMTDREVRAQVLSYSVNRATGYEVLSWDCDKFGNLDGIACQNAETNIN